MNRSTAVSSREHFACFVEQLRADLLAHRERWENRMLESFFGALHGYTFEVDGYYANNGLAVDADAASWRVFADLLKGASVYE